MSFLERIPRRIAFLILALIVVIPLVRPFPVMVPISDHTRNYYDTIDSLEPGSVVLVGANVGTRDLEMYPQLVATFKQLISKDAKIITYNFSPGAAMGAIWLFEDSGYTDLTYGEDYVHLGFVPGEDSALSAFCLDIVSTKQVDHYGNPTASMALFEDVNSIEDIDLVIASGGGTPGPDNWARIISIPYGTLSLVAVPGAFAARQYDYIALGVWQGGLIAQRGAVEYESLTGFAGRATSMYAPLLLSSIVLLLMMIAGNVVFWLNSRTREG